jgi:hypothetical protein
MARPQTSKGAPVSEPMLHHAVPPESPEREKKIQVMIVDDHRAMRHGLSTLLNLHAEGQASDGQQAIKLACKVRSDVILNGHQHAQNEWNRSYTHHLFGASRYPHHRTFNVG